MTIDIRYNAPMNEQPIQQWFESVWADREDRIYRDAFGEPSPIIHKLPASLFHAFGKPDPDPRFLTHALIEYPPTGDRPHYLYVSSGMSNPWGETPETATPANFSGLGFEFTLHAPQQAPWAIHLLHWLMTVQLLVATGDLQGQLLECHDRVPLGGPLWKKDGQLTHVLITPPPAADQPFHYPPMFHLASGRVDFLMVLGITEREAEFAKTQGEDALITVLRHHDVFPITDPARPSTI